MVDETPQAEGTSAAAQQHQPLVEGVTFAYDAPDKDKTEKEQVRVK